MLGADSERAGGRSLLHPFGALHAACRRLFDLAAAADLPDITQLPEKSRLSTLRKKFEEVYDIEHPVRAALEKLQTLDTVRIIEGKE